MNSFSASSSSISSSSSLLTSSSSSASSIYVSRVSSSSSRDDRTTIIKFDGNELNFPKWKKSVTLWFTSRGLKDHLLTPPTFNIKNSRKSFGLPIQSLSSHSGVHPSQTLDNEPVDEFDQQELDAAKLLAEIQSSKLKAKEAKNKAENAIIERDYFTTFLWLWSSLSDSVQSLFNAVPEGNTNALYDALCKKYQTASTNNQQAIRSKLFVDKLKDGEDMDVYIARMTGYELSLQDLKSSISQPDFMYHFYRGLPDMYADVVSDIKSKKDTLFTDVCTRLIDYQIDKRTREKNHSSNSSSLSLPSINSISHADICAYMKQCKKEH
jgi:gag-polypeptide of LTR copia-type